MNVTWRGRDAKKARGHPGTLLDAHLPRTKLPRSHGTPHAREPLTEHPSFSHRLWFYLAGAAPRLLTLSCAHRTTPQRVTRLANTTADVSAGAATMLLLQLTAAEILATERLARAHKCSSPGSQRPRMRSWVGGRANDREGRAGMHRGEQGDGGYADGRGEAYVRAVTCVSSLA